MSQGNQGSFRSRNRPYIYAIVLAILVTLFVFPEAIDDDSMEPAYEKGTVLLATKSSYSAKRGAPDWGSIVVMEKNYAPEISGDNIVARVLGLPGDTMEIREGTLYRNGEADDIGESTGSLGKDRKIQVDEDSVFLLYDNRDTAGDSRTKALGPVKLKEIKGSAKMVIWPLSQFGRVKIDE